MEGKILNSQAALFDKVILSFQEPYKKLPDDSNHPLSALIKQTDFFNRAFTSPLEFDKFIKLARPQLRYEVHQYGSLLYKEQDTIDKFYIVLKGSVSKFQQRPSSDIEQDIKESRSRDSRISLDYSQSPSPMNTNSPSRREFAFDMERNRALTWITADTNKFGGGDSPSTDLTSMSSKNLFETEMLKQLQKVSNLPSLIDESLESPKPLIKLTKMHSRQYQRSTSPSRKPVTHGAIPSIMDLPQNQPIVRPKVMIRCKTMKVIIEDSSPRKENKERVEIPAEDSALVQNLAMNYPDIRHRCFWKEVILVAKSKEFGPGKYFGQHFNKEETVKENSIIAVASEEAHLLSITREAFLEIINHLDTKTQVKTQFFAKVFPQTDETLIARFSQFFSQKTLQKGEVFYKQNDPPMELYLVRSGEVKLLKEGALPPQRVIENKPLSMLKPSKKIEVPVAVITKGQFFGEELLVKQTHRQYSAIANVSDTEVYYLSNPLDKYMRAYFADLFEKMKNRAHGGHQWKHQRSITLIRDSSQVQLTTKERASPSPTHKLDNKSSISFKESPEKFHSSSNSMSLRFPVKTPEVKLPDTQVLGKNLENEYQLTRNIETYKKKFARVIHLSYRRNDTETSREKSMQNLETTIGFSLNEMNIRKELETPSPSHKMKRRENVNKGSTTLKLKPRPPVKTLTSDIEMSALTATTIREEDNTIAGLIRTKSLEKAPKIVRPRIVQTTQLKDGSMSVSSRLNLSNAKGMSPTHIRLESLGCMTTRQDNKNLRKLLQLVHCQSRNMKLEKIGKGFADLSCVNMHTSAVIKPPRENLSDLKIRELGS